MSRLLTLLRSKGASGLERSLTIDNAGGAEKTDWTVEVNLTAANFDFAQAQADGSDVQFLDGATVLPYWIESWDAGAETAKVWVRVPAIPADGTASVAMRYGGAVINGSNIEATFPIGYDFSLSGVVAHPTLSSDAVVLATTEAFEDSAPHTHSVIDMGADHPSGYQYWGYYGPQGAGWVGLAYSNDLTTWVKEPAAVLTAAGLRWPSVIVVGGTIHMFVRDNVGGSSGIARYTSALTDGKTFVRQETVVTGIASGEQGNPFIFQDPDTGAFYLWYFRQVAGEYVIRYRTASAVTALVVASDVVALRSYDPWVLAAPAMIKFDGIYWLYVETNYLSTGTWRTLVLQASTPTGTFKNPTNAFLSGEDEACPFPVVFGSQLYLYTCKRVSSVWDVRLRTATAEAGSPTATGTHAYPWGTLRPLSPVTVANDGTIDFGQIALSAGLNNFAAYVSVRMKNFIARTRMGRAITYTYGGFRRTQSAGYRYWIGTSDYELATGGYGGGKTVRASGAHAATWSAGVTNILEIESLENVHKSRLNGTQVWSVTDANANQEGTLDIEAMSFSGDQATRLDWYTARKFDGVEPTVTVS